MGPSVAAGFSGRYILVADEDPRISGFVIQALREAGHAVFQCYDGRSAVQLVYALERCDLVITNTRVAGMPGIELVHQLRRDRPAQPILYLANIGRSTAELERELPSDVPVLREPFTAEQVREAAARLLAAGSSSR